MRGFAEFGARHVQKLEVSTVIEIGKFYVTESPHRRRYWITSCLPGAHIGISREFTLGDAFGNDYPWTGVAEQEG
jgi:hypothetical protein